MTIEHGKIEGDLHLDYELIMHGVIAGNVTVVKGGIFLLNGSCINNIVIEKGAKATLNGNVGGNVLNQGGQLKVYGTVDGHVHTTDDGITYIDRGAVVKGKSR